MPMSNAGTEHKLPHNPAEAARTLGEEARFGAGFLRRHWRKVLLAFLGVLAPLWGFGELADEVREAEAFPFDGPMLQLAHARAGEGFDRIFLALTHLGYEWGVVPIDVLLILALALTGWMREGLFAGVSLIGSALLNLGAKQLFARTRPVLWESIAPEATYSFPSGHAMGSMTLAVVLVLLAWHTRWLWWVAVPMALFVLLVGLSRVYLGVHYPSDILAGWVAAIAWVVACYLLVFRGAWPWQASRKPP